MAHLKVALSLRPHLEAMKRVVRFQAVGDKLDGQWFRREHFLHLSLEFDLKMLRGDGLRQADGRTMERKRRPTDIDVRWDNWNTCPV